MKIMFICAGNTCRSAMAHAILEKKIKDNNLDVQVYSSGIYAENGDTATYNAIQAMNKYGIDLKAHRAINISDSNIEEMDLILCMTTSHKTNIIKIYPKLKDRIYTLKEYIKCKDIDINDPWGYSSATYEKVAQELEEYINKLIDIIMK